MNENYLPAYNQLRRLPRTLIVIALVGLVVFAWSRIAPQQAVNSSKAVSPRKIISKSGLTPLWAKPYEIDRGSDKSKLIMLSNRLIVAGDRNLRCFDVLTGNVVWDVKQLSTDEISGGIVVDSKRNRLYARQYLWGIIAVSLMDGKVLWGNSSPLFTNKLPDIYLGENDEPVFVIGNKIYSFDPDNGQVGNEVFTAQSGEILFINEEFVFLGWLEKQQLTVQAINYKTQQIAWSTAIKSVGMSEIQVIGNTILINNETEIIALDRSIGKQKWSVKDEFISDIAIVDQYGLALNSNARLNVFSLEDGAVLSTIEFEPPTNKDNLLYAPGQIGGSWIAASTDALAIYFQDTNALNVYKGHALRAVSQ